MTIMTTSEEEERIPKLVPTSTSSVSKAVSNVRNADGSVRARIHFAEKPENPYLEKMLDGVEGTAVTWEVHGLKPHAAFRLRVCEFGDLRRGTHSAGPIMSDILTLKYLVLCGEDSGWRRNASRDEPLLIANAEGIAQGISIEPELRVHDVLGRMIAILEVYSKDRDITEAEHKKRGPALGVVGCQCLKRSQ